MTCSPRQHEGRTATTAETGARTASTTSDWMGTGLNVCYAGEHEAEKAETESISSGGHWGRAARDANTSRTDGRQRRRRRRLLAVSPYIAHATCMRAY